MSADFNLTNKLTTKGIYSDGMVLLRNSTNCIFGTSLPNAEVIIKFNNLEFKSKANNQGQWKIEFNPGKEGGPFDFIISSNQEKIIYKDVYIGEVWLNCGQSNAQLPMQRMAFTYREEMENPEQRVHMITIPISYEFNQEIDYIENPTWLTANQQNIGLLSGTGYFFAKNLAQELNVHVGIINASQGGSPITSWINQDSIIKLNNKDFIARIKKWQTPGIIQKEKDSVLKAQQKYDSAFNEMDVGLKENWQNIDFSSLDSSWSECVIPNDFDDLKDNSGVIWFKKEIQISKEQLDQFNSKKTHIWCGTIVDSDKVWVNEVFCGETGYLYPPRRYLIPSGTLHEGKNTITIRVVKSGFSPLRFYKEKPYCIFTDDVWVYPTAYRNLDKPENSAKKFDNSKGIKIELSGKWKKCISCSTKEKRPGELFLEWEPTALYNSMLAPCFNYAINGAVWYQGESNCYVETAKVYNNYLLEMFNLWRKKFVYAPKDMNVVVVGLPNWSDGWNKQEFADDCGWAILRNAQKIAVEEDGKSSLAVLVDAGEWNDLHPEKKAIVGKRASLEALRVTYKKDKPQSPVFKTFKKDENTFTLKFECKNSKLKAFYVQNECASFDKESDVIYGFSFVDKNGTITEVQGKLISDTEVQIELPSKVKNPVELRYLWENNPWIVNLYNKDLLPAMPFKLDL